MKRIYWKIGWVLLLLALCVSEGSQTVVRAREINQLELVTALGVDRVNTEDGTLRVIALGNESRDNSPMLVETEQQTMAQAVSQLRVIPEQKLFFGHVGQFILGEEAAKQDLGEQLDFIARDISMRLDTDIYVVKGGTAEDLIRATTSQNRTTFDYLRDAEDDMLILPISYPFNTGEVLQQLLVSDGCALVAAVTIEIQEEPSEGSNQTESSQGNDGEKTQEAQGGTEREVEEKEKTNSTPTPVARLDGYAVFRDYHLAGYIDAEDAPGVNLLLDKLRNDYVVVEGPEGGDITLKVTRDKTKLQPEFEGDTLKRIVISVTASADINEVQGVDNATDPSVLQYIKQQLCQKEVALVEKTVAQAQMLKADYLGIGEKIEIAAPAQWKKIQGDWKSLFPTVPFQVEAEVRINQTYDLSIPVEGDHAEKENAQR